MPKVARFKEKEILKDKVKKEYPTVQFRNAVRYGDSARVNKCLKFNKVDPNALFVGKQTALHLVAEQGMFETAKTLLDNRKTKIDPVSLHGYTPLMLASQTGNISMMQLLMKYQAQKSKQDFHGRTILHWTVLQNNLYATHFLLQSRTDPNIMDIYGHTPLHLASTVLANLPLARILLKYKADPLMSFCPNLNTYFELCLIANNKNYENILRYMLKYISDVNILDGVRKQCALHMVAITNYLPVAKILLDKGVDRTIKDFNGRTPYDLAIHLQNNQVASFLNHYIMPSTIKAATPRPLAKENQ